MLSTAGWAVAAKRVLGDSWIVGPSGTMEVAEARRLGSASELTSGGPAPWHRRVPTVVKTFAKDVRQAVRGRRFHISPAGPWTGQKLDFVWQRHELFHTAGIDLARRLDCPSVLFVPATMVWEAERWGVRRPGWSGITERLGECPALRSADLVACGSTEVAEQVKRLGVPTRRIIVTPTGVDLSRFPSPGPSPESAALRKRLGLDEGIVVGWVGSFRPFHRVEQLIEAAAGLEGLSLLLVGDGPERARLAGLAAELGVRAAFTGTVAHASLPEHFAAMDVAVVLASADGAFHYSPLKLAEYLAAGVPTIVPSVPTVLSRLSPGLDAVVVEPGDVDELRRAIVRLRDDPAERTRLAAAARKTAELRWSWDSQVQRVVEALAERQPSSATSSQDSSG